MNDVVALEEGIEDYTLGQVYKVRWNQSKPDKTPSYSKHNAKVVFIGKN